MTPEQHAQRTYLCSRCCVNQVHHASAICSTCKPKNTARAQRVTRIVEYQGRLYEVSTDEAIRTTAPTTTYAHVTRIRKDGTRGHRITRGDIIHTIIHAGD